MDALILAAGFGERLRPLSPSKPLTPIAGIALLDLAIRQAAACGAQRVVVVTGHEADRVEAALPQFARSAGVPVGARRLERWDLPNGHSVIAGASEIAGDYLLMMADHVFSRAILQLLAGEAGNGAGVTLAIDRRIAGPLIDPDDATWVETAADGAIVRIGKTIPHYDAVDCGAFLATPELAPAIAQAIDQGRPGSLSDGMQLLADARRASTVDIGRAWWIDVDDPRMHALAEAQAPAALPEFYARPAAAPAAAAAQARAA